MNWIEVFTYLWFEYVDFRMRAAVSINRQVAQAMGYLHARGIVYGKLNPHNIFLEGDNYRVKLSLLDHGLVDSASLL